MQNIFDTLIFPSIIAAIVALIIGAVSTYVSGVKIEKFKIKSVVIQSNINKIMELLKCLNDMHVGFMVTDKTFNDLTINIDMDSIEKNIVTIPSIFDIHNGQVNSKWRVDFDNLSEDVNQFGSKEIKCFTHILREYLITLDRIAMRTNPINRWQIGYIITKDLRDLSSSYQELLYTYLNVNIYKPKFKNSYDSKLVDRYREEVLEKTRLYSQEKEIKKLYYK